MLNPERVELHVKKVVRGLHGYDQHPVEWKEEKKGINTQRQVEAEKTGAENVTSNHRYCSFRK
jgi:hypothetical protein